MTKRTVTVDGREVALSSQDKVLFPDSGITKGELCDYWIRIAETMLPHVRDRPLTLARYPDGIGEEGFFQKQAAKYFPAWIPRVRMNKKDGHVDHAVADSAAALVYLGNQNTVSLHAPTARASSLYHPDRLIFDLDPSTDDFADVRRAAGRVRALLRELDLTGRLMLTGSRGVHVVVALDGEATYGAVYDFAESAAETLAARHPDELTTEFYKKDRGDRVFVDYLRNAYAQTAIVPYSPRARAGAPVACPIAWDELDEAGPDAYTIRTVFERLDDRGDTWADVDASPASVAAAAATLDALDA